jgi:hypothetical protein
VNSEKLPDEVFGSFFVADSSHFLGVLSHRSKNIAGAG